MSPYGLLELDSLFKKSLGLQKFIFLIFEFVHVFSLQTRHQKTSSESLGREH